MSPPECKQDNLSFRLFLLCSLSLAMYFSNTKTGQYTTCSDLLVTLLLKGKMLSAKVQEFQLPLLLRFLTAAGSICYHRVRQILTSRICVSVLL